MQVVQVGWLSFYIVIFIKHIKEMHWFMEREVQADPGEAGMRHPYADIQEWPVPLSPGQCLWVGFILRHP